MHFHPFSYNGKVKELVFGKSKVIPEVLSGYVPTDVVIHVVLINEHRLLFISSFRVSIDLVHSSTQLSLATSAMIFVQPASLVIFPVKRYCLPGRSRGQLHTFLSIQTLRNVGNELFILKMFIILMRQWVSRDNSLMPSVKILTWTTVKTKIEVRVRVTPLSKVSDYSTRFH